MEADNREVLSPLLSRSDVKKQFEYLEQTVDEAQKRIDYELAHDADVLKAIDVVERFLRRKRRVCYGGQAINSLLPKARKFYDEKYTIPDYDFFTPERDADVDEIISDLQKEGFTEVNKKVGIHDGTMKVMVNYIAVADCTFMLPSFFKIIQKRAKVVNGILYTDPDFLRMLMHLELSRPRGQIERWKKVYERLTLLNSAYPIQKCYDEIKVDETVGWRDREIILDYCIGSKRVLLGPEGIELLEKKSDTTIKELLEFGGPVIMLSADAQKDATDLVEILAQGNERIKKSYKIHFEDVQLENIYKFVTIKFRNQPIALIYQGVSCHSYISFKVDDQELRLASPDLYLNIYYSAMIFGKKELAYFQTSLQCLIQKLHKIVDKARSSPSRLLPAFGLRCSGREHTMATLLRQRQERTESEKKKGKEKKEGKKARKTRRAERK